MAAVRLSVERALKIHRVAVFACAAIAAAHTRADDAYHRCAPALQKAYAGVPAVTFAPTVFVLPKEPAIKGVQAGSVDLFAKLKSDGRVREVCVLDSEPPGVFDGVAVEAVAQWRYAPKDIAEIPHRRIKVHVSFLVN